jgi:hypothetical protein
VRRRQAIVAGIAAALLVTAAALQVSGPQAKVSELTIQLILINKRFPLDVIGAVVQGFGLIGLVWTLAFLFDAARARRPEMAPPSRIAAVSGGVVSAVGSVIYAIVLAIKSHQFVTQGDQTYQQANHLTKGAALPVLQTVDIAAQFALEIGLILIALNAMRVGLLTRFMGYTGMVVGVAGMLLIGSAPAAALQIFWLGGLAYLFAGRWPGGDPPAWRTGRAEPWPSAQQLREQRMRAGGAAAPKAKPRPTPEPAPQAVGAPASSRTRATTPKRKRKRRR